MNQARLIQNEVGGGFYLSHFHCGVWIITKRIDPSDYPAVAEAFQWCIDSDASPEAQRFGAAECLRAVVGKTIDADRLPERLRP